MASTRCLGAVTPAVVAGRPAAGIRSRGAETPATMRMPGSVRGCWTGAAWAMPLAPPPVRTTLGADWLGSRVWAAPVAAPPLRGATAGSGAGSAVTGRVAAVRAAAPFVVGMAEPVST